MNKKASKHKYNNPKSLKQQTISSNRFVAFIDRLGHKPNLFIRKQERDYIYDRTYPKLQSVLANISALIKVIVVISDVISLFTTGN